MKKIIAICAVLTIAAAMPAAAEEHTAKTVNGHANVCGKMPGKQGETVTIKVTNGDTIQHIDQQKIDSNGQYNFSFEYDPSYTVLVNYNGTAVNESITAAEALTYFDADIKLAEDGAVAKLFANINNIYNFDTANRNIKIITAFYNENAVLMGTGIYENAEFNKDMVRKMNIPSGSTKIKCYLWEDLKPLIAGVQKNIGENKSISCWGDSLTYGVGADSCKSYPAVLQELVGDNITVHNMGIGGETTATIAARQGGVPFKLLSDVTIPADKSAVNVWLDSTAPLVQPGNDGINPCYIDNIMGTLTYNNNTGKYYFTRSEAGAAKKVLAGSEIITNASLEKSGDISIIFTGANDELIYEHQQNALIERQKNMIKKLGDNPEYIVIGITTKTLDERHDINELMKKTYGNRYIDMKTYLSDEKTYQDNNITLTDEDKQDISEGKIPRSILISDVVHFNNVGYKLIANKVYEKLSELGIVVGK